MRLQPVQRAAYKTTLEGLVKDVASADEVRFKKQLASFAARRAMLLQLCSNPSGVLADYDETPAKTAALDSILTELIDVRGEKVVLWSFFTRSLDSLFVRYGRFRPVRIDGTIPDARSRRDAVQRFQDDPATMLFVGNPAAAGAGLTLHRARFAIYESMSNQAAHYLQSLDRIHRRGQDRPVEYIVLLCDETIELREFDRLVHKERAAQDLLGDEVKPVVTRETFLAELEEAARLLTA